MLLSNKPTCPMFMKNRLSILTLYICVRNIMKYWALAVMATILSVIVGANGLFYHNNVGFKNSLIKERRCKNVKHFFKIIIIFDNL